MRLRWLAGLALAATAHAQEPLEVPPGQVSLDDVWCAVCHFEQADEFGLSVHYRRGLMLCNDCHGGDPLEPHPEKAKAPSTGFIGKPGRTAIAAVCGRCHTGPAASFASSPHADAANPDNPTCISCHQNHLVLEADVALLERNCAACHAGDRTVLDGVEDLRTSMAAADLRLATVADRFDSLLRLDPGLRRSAGLLDGAAAALRQVEPRTHTVRAAAIDSALAAFDDEAAAVDAVLDAAEAARRRRGWVVAGIWGFVLVNVALLWVKRRQL